MKRSCGYPMRSTALALAFVVIAVTTTHGGVKRWRDDQIPFGPAGTIGRGTDSAADPPYNVRGGIPLFTFGRGYDSDDPGESSSPAPRFTHSHGSFLPGHHATPAVPGPYPTNQHCEPGDGYRYPLYYNPATRTYFYYPVQR